MKDDRNYSKIYMIAGCFPPFGRGNAITNMCVANGLSRNFDLTVVCMHRNDGGVISYQDDQSLVEGVNKKINVKRVKPANWWGMNTLLYVLGVFPCYFFNWTYSVIKERHRLFNTPGVIFAVYPVFSDLIIGYIISRIYDWPLLVDFRDDFSGVMSRKWRRIFRRLYIYLEKKIVNKASHITVTTNGLKNDLLSRYGLDEQKVTVVYNIVPPSIKKEDRPDCREPSKHPLLVLYAGAMSFVQRPEILLLAHKYLLDNDTNWTSRIRIELYGPLNPYFRLKVKPRLAQNCLYKGFVPQNIVADRLLRTDIGFFSLSDSIYSYATPTKLFDYIENGVPIVASLPRGASRDIIEEYKIGLVADIGDVEGLARQLKRMVEEDMLRAECRKNMGQIREFFSTKSQIDRWKDILIGLKVANLD